MKFSACILLVLAAGLANATVDPETAAPIVKLTKPAPPAQAVTGYRPKVNVTVPAAVALGCSCARTLSFCVLPATA